MHPWDNALFFPGWNIVSAIPGAYGEMRSSELKMTAFLTSHHPRVFTTTPILEGEDQYKRLPEGVLTALVVDMDQWDTLPVGIRFLTGTRSASTSRIIDVLRT